MCLQKVTQFFFFRAEIVFRGGDRFGLTWNAFYHTDAGAFQSLDFLRIVGEKPYFMNSKMLKNRPGKLIGSVIGLKTKLFVRLYCVRAGILQFIRSQLIHQADPSALLMLINEQPASFFTDLVQSEFKLSSAVATETVEDIARKTLRVDSYQRRRPGNVAETEYNRLFDAGSIVAFETEDPKMPEPAREIGFCYF